MRIWWCHDLQLGLNTVSTLKTSQMTMSVLSISFNYPCSYTMLLSMWSVEIIEIPKTHYRTQIQPCNRKTDINTTRPIHIYIYVHSSLFSEQYKSLVSDVTWIVLGSVTLKINIRKILWLWPVCVYPLYKSGYLRLQGEHKYICINFVITLRCILSLYKLGKNIKKTVIEIE